MPNSPVTQVLCSFLDRHKTIYNADLVARYNRAMECQLNVQRGEPVAGGACMYSDGVRTWWDIHVPKKASTDPCWEDYPMSWPPEWYATDFGMSGWNWERRVSLWVGFDVDSILGGHKDGLTPEQLEEVLAALRKLSYVEIRRSTGGAGYHVYVHLADIPTENHAIHAVLARAVLGKISADTGRDFSADVDAYGAILFCWSKRASEAERSYELLKSSTQVLTEAELPGWRAAVLPPRTCKKQDTRDTDGTSDESDELCSAFPVVKRDAKHDEILDEYQARGWPLAWITDKNCYHAHTKGLEEVHQALKLAGIFETTSPGTDKTRPNCFMFVRPNGALFVVRFQSPVEAPCWSTTADGHPCILFNALPDVRTACLSAGAVEGNGVYTFSNIEQAKEAACNLGLKLPDLEDRSINFTVGQGKLVAVAERSKKETPEGWATTARRLSVSFPLAQPAEGAYEYDHIVRHVRNNDDGIDKDGGFVVKARNGRWAPASDSRAVAVLMSLGMSKTDAQTELGDITRVPWYEVNEPFKDEYLPDRQWNMRGAKLKYVPAEPCPTPYWDRVFDHCGLGLDEAVAKDKWCQDHGIRTGGDYLRWYTAALIRLPKKKLPYLFFVSEGESGQETGKSTWARAVSLLFARGSVDAKLALSEKFNLQLAGAVFCWLEEAALTRDAYLRIKQWVDAPRITIRAMRRDGYSIPNYAHFTHSGNKQDNCPFELGDTRVVVIEVPPLDPEEWLDWDEELTPVLEREAPDFLGRLYVLPLPQKGHKRLYLPVLVTTVKKTMLEAKRRESEEREGRRTLLQAMIALAKRGRWKGTAEELIVALGKSHGEWSSIATHFGRQLKKTRKELLAKYRVRVSYRRSGGRRLIFVAEVARAPLNNSSPITANGTAPSPSRNGKRRATRPAGLNR